MQDASIQASIVRYLAGERTETTDVLAVEEPLEIRLEYGDKGNRQFKNISVTMRTPGADQDLAAGFLFTEGIIRNPGDISTISHHEKMPGILVDDNVIVASLHESCQIDFKSLERNFYTTSSCGVCGKASIDAIKTTSHFAGTEDQLSIPSAVLYQLPALARKAQDTFESTGGLHAAALFSETGNLIAIREDVGRHNALDKLIGHCLMQQLIPLQQHILLLSGRASFELLQKAAMAGIKLVCAVGAPSSLAVETALGFGITLCGFLKDNRMNVYSNPQRIKS